MAYLACVSVPRLGLQLFGHQAPKLRNKPMAVISEDKPLGVVLEANRHALQEGVKPGMRYAAALSIVPGLQAIAISPEAIDQAIVRITQRLLSFSPSVEPASIGAGTFWLNADGLDRLFGNRHSWAQTVCLALSKPDETGDGFFATVAVGFTRFGTYSAARMFRRNTVFTTYEAEQEALRKAPLRILPFDPETADTLSRLGIHTIRGFLRLPEGAVQRRFGADAASIHRFVAGRSLLPVQSLNKPAQPSRSYRFASSVVNKNNLLLASMQLFKELYDEIIRRRLLVKQLDLLITIETGWEGVRPQPVEATLRPAAPTLDRCLLEKLIRLRIDTSEIPGPVEEIMLKAATQQARHAQSDLFIAKPKRDSAAADRAFALIRAEMGNNSVCTARILPEHLPLRKYRWEPIEHLPPAGENTTALAGPQAIPRKTHPISLVRHICVSKKNRSRIAARNAGKVSAHGDAPVRAAPSTSERSLLFSGGWWDKPYEIEYRYITNVDGATQWLMYDRQARQRLVQGAVE